MSNVAPSLPLPAYTFGASDFPSLTPFQPLADPAAEVTTVLLPSSVSMTPTHLPPTSISPSPLPETASSTPLPLLSRAQYILTVSMDYGAHTLAVSESIQYPNLSGDTLHELILAVESNRWPGCLKMGTITIDGQPPMISVLNGIRLQLTPTTAIAPGQQVSLSLQYALQLPAADIHQVFGYHDLQTNLVDWYPFIVPYASGEGWLLHQPANVGEHLVYDSVDFDVTLKFTDPTPPLVVAASSPGDPVARGWHYHLANARTFVLSVSPSYLSSSLSVGQVTVTSYYFKSQTTAGQVVLQQVAKAVTTYSDLFGPYPTPSLTIVEAEYDDGLEQTGLFFLSQDFYTEYDGTVLNNLIDIGVHETAHQWWFSLVGNDQALEPWLDEAMATYSEHLFYQENYPDVTAWWSFRVDKYHPSGWVDTNIYQGGSYRTYTNAVYLRGALFLEAIRQRVGDVVFFAFLRDYADQMAGKRATAADFFRILRQHTPVDISGIISSFFQNQY
ncbi:MAG: M1 family aminopeptidase [Anaerolineales bacterium]